MTNGEIPECFSLKSITVYYYGVNADWQLGNQWRVYGQIAREEGDDYTKEYDISLGLKYQF